MRLARRYGLGCGKRRTLQLEQARAFDRSRLCRLVGGNSDMLAASRRRRRDHREVVRRKVNRNLFQTTTGRSVGGVYTVFIGETTGAAFGAHSFEIACAQMMFFNC